MKTIAEFREAYAAGMTPLEALRPVWEIEGEAVYIRKSSWAEVEAQVSILDTLGHPEECPLVEI